MTEIKSCLNCKYGKPEKQEQGYYCGGEGSHADVFHFTPRKLATISHSDRNHHHMDWVTGYCGQYKPRLNQCETKGCRWFDDYHGEDFCYYDDDLCVGEICEHFEKEESIPNRYEIDGCEYMDEVCQGDDSIVGLHPCFAGKECKYFKQKEDIVEKFEFKGKTYETGKPISLASAWADNPCTDIFDLAVHIFEVKYGFTGEIALNQKNFDLFTDVMKEWLIEKDYLVEIVEEETYKVGQWFKMDDSFYLLIQNAKPTFILVGLKNNVIWGTHNTLKKMTKMINEFYFTPIFPPTITKQPDKVERSPEKCVHHDKNNKRWCARPGQVKGYYCEDDRFLRCLEYIEE